RARVLFLTVRSDGEPQPHALREGPTIIGRALDCDIVINHESVSRRHAQIVIEGATAVVSDLNSSSGLFRNGERVKTTAVAAGDVLWFGSVEATIDHQPAARLEESPVETAAPAIELEHTIYRRVDAETRAPATAVDANRVIRLLG